MTWLSAFLAWLLVFATPATFEVRMDRLKVFYSRESWRRARTTA